MLDLILVANGLSELTDGQFVERCDKIEQAIAKYSVINTTFSAFTAKFTELVGKVKAALVAPRGKLYTTRLREVDHLRDQVHSALIHLLRAYSNGLNADKRAAANALYHVAKPFGFAELRKADYDTQTAKTEGLISALRGSDYTDQMTLLNEVKAFVDDLETVNNDFKALDKDQLEEEGKRLGYLVGDVRKQIMPIYNNLVNTCLGMANSEIDQQYVDFIKEINVINSN